MVSGRSAVDTAGRSVFQCAETATIALGRGNREPSDARKSRAGRFSRISVGDPCDTKTDGIDICSILTQHLKLARQEVAYGWLAQGDGGRDSDMGIARRTGDGPNDAAHGEPRRHQDPRSDL